jgi:hypothetical protein
MNRKILIAVFCFFIALTLLCRNIPFFWDGTFFSSLAADFYNKGLNGFIAPLPNDTGGFPLFSFYLACAWKICGKTLLVSHLAMLPFLLGITWEYFRLAKRWLSGQMLVLAMLLLVAEPVFLTQSILMGYDVIISYFFLLALNALLDKKRIFLSVALIFLCMISVRGMMLTIAILLLDLSRNRKDGYALIKSYLPVFTLAIAWICYHHYRTGWYIFSPTRESNAESFAGPKMIFRQLCYIAWKNLDTGRVTLWLTLIVGYRYFLKKTTEGKQIMKLILIPLITLSVFMCLIKNPISPKYFMTVFLLLNIAVTFIIRQLDTKSIRAIIFGSVLISLICGNFILYPQRYGNSWDSTLKVLPYFAARTEMDDYVQKNNFRPYTISSQFPLTADHEASNFVPFWNYVDIDEQLPEGYRYFLYSNVINTDQIDLLNKIRTTWIKVKEIRKGQIVMILFRNPSFSEDWSNGLSSTDQHITAVLSPGKAMP